MKRVWTLGLLLGLASGFVYASDREFSESELRLFKNKIMSCKRQGRTLSSSDKMLANYYERALYELDVIKKRGRKKRRKDFYRTLYCRVK